MDTTSFTRVPPHDDFAERAFLYCVIEDNGKFYDFPYIKSDFFYNPIRKAIYVAIEKLSAKSMPFDVVTILNELDMTQNANGLKNEFANELLGLRSPSITMLNVKHYANIIVDNHIKRMAIIKANELNSNAYQGNIHEALSAFEDSMQKVRDDCQENTETNFKDLVQRNREHCQNLSTNKTKENAIYTGYVDLDKKLNGASLTDLMVIAARPSMGKTALALNILEKLCNNADNPIHTGYLSLEMNENQISQRMIFTKSRVNETDFMSDMPDAAKMKRYMEVTEQMGSTPIHIIDKGCYDIAEVKAKAFQLKKKYDIKVLAIDHLNLMSDDTEKFNRQNEISSITRKLKRLAKELNILIILITQLSRAVESRSDKRPLLSDLRESGAVEQDADSVIFIYRDEYYNPETEMRNIAEIIIAKNRNGETGTVCLAWESQYTAFYNLENSTAYNRIAPSSTPNDDDLPM